MSLLYWSWLKDSDAWFGKKIAAGVLLTYILYYALYHLVFSDTVYSNIFIWIVAIDVFILAVLLMKYKGLKWRTFSEKICDTIAFKQDKYI